MLSDPLPPHLVLEIGLVLKLLGFVRGVHRVELLVLAHHSGKFFHLFSSRAKPFAILQEASSEVGRDALVARPGRVLRLKSFEVQLFVYVSVQDRVPDELVVRLISGKACLI